MKLAQRKIKWLARLMLGLVLFAQGIVAASACIAPDASPVQAYAIVQHAGDEQHDGMDMPCHAAEEHNANACLTHCTQSDQISVDQHMIFLAAPVSVATLQLPMPSLQHKRLTAVPEHLALNTGPPLSIRFCSFLI